MKSGLDWFPLDVNLDTKFEFIEAEFGLQGFAVVVKLLQRIYGEQGYYCEWTTDVELLFAKNLNVSCGLVSEIVKAAIRRGIFDKKRYEKYGVLTSKGIQNRYFEAIGRRKEAEVKFEYLMVELCKIPQNVNISSENVNISSENVNISKQSKVKDSKVTESNIYIVEIVDYLNKKTGARYNPKTRDTVSHINARLNEGYTVEQFKQVIDKKCADWLNNPQMREYLRPATLFCTKFESYLNSAITAKATDKTDPTNYYGDDDSEEFLKQYG